MNDRWLLNVLTHQSDTEWLDQHHDTIQDAIHETLLLNQELSLAAAYMLLLLFDWLLGRPNVTQWKRLLMMAGVILGILLAGSIRAETLTAPEYPAAVERLLNHSD